MQLYITSLSYGNNIMMDTKSATLVNSLSPGKLLYHIAAVSFKLISRHIEHPWEISHSACHMTLFFISQHCSRHWPGAVRRQATTWGNDDHMTLFFYQSALFQALAWCRKAASHYLGQWWPWAHICCHRTLPGHNGLTTAIRYIADNNKYLLIFLNYSMKWSNIHSSHPDPDVPPVDIVATGGNTMDHKIGTVTTHYFR